MDRISALRNVEEALATFEAGDSSLPELEREVRGVLRTYATEFDERQAWRASGEPPAEGLVVLATSRTAARERVAHLADLDSATAARVDIEPLE